MNALQRLEIILSLVFSDAERELIRPKTDDDVDWKLVVKYHERKITVFWSKECNFSITIGDLVLDVPELPVAIIETIKVIETGRFMRPEHD